jgi:hypothetical protein
MDRFGPNVIRVIRSSSGEYRVVPPVLVVADNEDISVRNLTNDNLRFDFAAGPGPTIPILLKGSKVTEFPVVGGGTETFTVAGAARDYYNYAVLAGRFRATGNSDPSIIVD